MGCVDGKHVDKKRVSVCCCAVFLIYHQRTTRVVVKSFMDLLVPYSVSVSWELGFVPFPAAIFPRDPSDEEIQEAVFGQCGREGCSILVCDALVICL